MVAGNGCHVPAPGLAAPLVLSDLHLRVVLVLCVSLCTVLLAKTAKGPRKQDDLYVFGGRQDGQSDDIFSMADELV